MHSPHRGIIIEDGPDVTISGALTEDLGTR